MKKRIFKLGFTVVLTAIIAAALFVAVSAETYTGECGTNVTYTLNTSTGVLEITGTGNMTNYSSSSSVPWYSYRNYIKTVKIGDSVTSIGLGTFSGCSSLTSVEIPDSVTSIGNSAFSGCSSLTSVEIPDSVTSIGNYAFRDCSSLTSVEIGDSVTNIGDYAFRDCSSLTSVEIGDSVTRIGYQTFRDCSSLTSVEIGDSVTNIGDYAFRDCSSLTSVEIGDSVTSIGFAAFDGCSSLTSVEIPDSVTSIGNYVFYGCSSLTSVEIPDSVTKIGERTFYNCSSLTSVVIPDSVTSIGYYAFYRCSSLTSVTFRTKNTTIGTYAFDYCDALETIYCYKNSTADKYFSDEKYNKTYLGIPVEISSIKCGSNATWSLNTETGKMTIDGSGEIWDCGTFEGGYLPYPGLDATNGHDYREYIKSVTILEGITHIGFATFSGDVNLKEITIPRSVKYIDFNAFPNCTNLSTIYLYKNSYADKFFDSSKYEKIYLDTIVNRYLEGSINTTNNSFYVGDEVQLLVYEVIETLDGNITTAIPENILVGVSQTTQNAILKLVSEKRYDDICEYRFEAISNGWADIQITNGPTQKINININIDVDEYKTYRANKVETYEYDIGIEKDWYNYYVSGMYVSDFKCTTSGTEAYKYEFNVFNESYISGVIEVYDANDKLIDIKKIEKNANSPASLKEIWDSGINGIVDIKNGDAFSFRSSMTSKASNFCGNNSITVPNGGYIIITSSSLVSEVSFLMNTFDLFIELSSVLDDSLDIDDEILEEVTKEMAFMILADDIGRNLLKKFNESLVDKVSGELRDEGLFEIYVIIAQNFKSMLTTLDIDIVEIAKSAGESTGFGIAQDFLEKFGGPAGAALNISFGIGKLTNILGQFAHFNNSFDNAKGVVIYTPYINDRATTTISSNVGVSVQSASNFPSGTILQAYNFFDYKDVTQTLSLKDNESYQLYDLSLVNDETYTDIGETISVSIPVFAKKFASVSVAKLDDDGNWIIIKSEVIDDKVVFESSQLGVFAIITLSKSGDPSGDGEINAVDAVLLAQKIAGWDVELDISAADCNGDGEVNAIDAVLLAQKIAGWDVVLG